MAETLGEMCPAVMWEAELVNDKPRYLAEISKQSVEGSVWFLLAADSKMWEERDTLRETQ